MRTEKLTHQYARGTARGDLPEEVYDPTGDAWVWVDADPQGVPGYQWIGGRTIVRQDGPLGPAHTIEYVVQGRFRYDWQGP